MFEFLVKIDYKKNLSKLKAIKLLSLKKFNKIKPKKKKIFTNSLSKKKKKGKLNFILEVKKVKSHFEVQSTLVDALVFRLR